MTDPPEAPKRQRGKRVITSKSKGGCTTCRPICQRCIKANRDCAWSTLEQGVSIPNLVSKRFENAEEASGFQFYVSRMSERQHYYGYSRIWGITIPQAAQDHPALKHAILAVGNQQLSAEVQSSWAKDVLTNSIKHYCKAMNSLTSTKPSIEVLLLCCLLFFSYENMFALKDRTHAANGIKLIHEYQSQKENRTLGHDLIVEELAPLFDGLLAEIVAITQPPREESYTQWLQPSRGRPAPFVPKNLPNGYEAFNSLSGISMHINAKSQLRYSSSDGEIRYFDKRDIVDLLARWSQATARLSTSQFSVDAEENRLRILETQHKSLTIAVDSYFPRDEMKFDFYNEDFAFIVARCRHVIQGGCVLAQPTLGFIPPLFLTATRCRDPKLRREAQKLLQSIHRHQTQWDTCTAAAVAEWVINFEERGRSNICSAADVPEADRLCIFGVNSDPEHETMEVQGWVQDGGEQRLTRWNFSYKPCPRPDCGGPRGQSKEWPRVNLLLSLGCNVTVASVPAFIYDSPTAFY